MEKKTNLTNNSYQSIVLPIIQVAETEIKKLVNFYALYYKPKRELTEKINGIIRAVAKRLPISLFDREKYLIGLKQTSEKMIREFYDPVIESFKKTLVILGIIGITIKADTPLKLNEVMKTNKKLIKEIELKEPTIWSARKGYPNVVNYQNELKKKLHQLARTQTVSGETGKKPISLWQKAEIDLRHENQMTMIDNLKTKGVKLAWTSTHPDCSKRCEKWQGKLFDLQAQHSDLSGHRMNYKVDGNTVYCFNEVINKIDKYGYTNNIIVGFNCRHKLREYIPGSVAPQEYSAKSIKREREINTKLRAMEREIRYLKQQVILYNSIDKKLARITQRKVDRLIAAYKEFANKNGYAWYEYRIKV